MFSSGLDTGEDVASKEWLISGDFRSSEMPLGLEISTLLLRFRFSFGVRGNFLTEPKLRDSLGILATGVVRCVARGFLIFFTGDDSRSESSVRVRSWLTSRTFLLGVRSVRSVAASLVFVGNLALSSCWRSDSVWEVTVTRSAIVSAELELLEGCRITTPLRDNFSGETFLSSSPSSSGPAGEVEIMRGGEDLGLSELSDSLRGVLDLLRAFSICFFSFVSSNCSSLN